MRTAIHICIFLGSLSCCIAQDHLSWEDLGDVTWVEEHDDTLGMTNLIGSFGEHLQSFNGKEVSYLAM